MNDHPILADVLVEEMLARRAAHPVPVGLAAAIRTAVAQTAQVRRSWWAAALPAVPRTSGLRLAWMVAVAALLLAVVLASILVAGHLLRPIDLPVVTLPSTAPSPAASETITASAFGPITWRTLDTVGLGPFQRLTGTPFGPVGLTAEGLRWRAPGGAWAGMPLDDSWERLFSVDTRVLVSTSSAFWLTRSGPGWTPGEAVDLEGALDVDDVVSGQRGIVITDGTGIEYSTDGIHFVRAAHAPDKSKLEGRASTCNPWAWSGEVGDGRIGPLLSTDAGFIALMAATPDQGNVDLVCEPVLWRSADGSEWQLVAPVSPFGEGASVREVASRAGRHVAIGNVVPDETNPHGDAVWVSDDGLAWQRLPVFEPEGTCFYWETALCSHVPSRVTAADAGWVLLDWDGFAWTSTDGLTWQQLLGWPEIHGGWVPQEVAFSPGSIVVGMYDEAAVIGTFEP